MKKTLKKLLVVFMVMSMAMGMTSMTALAKDGSGEPQLYTDAYCKFNYRLHGEYAIITGIKGDCPEILSLPKTVDGYEVERVDGFIGMENLKCLYCNGINIGKSAFSECKNLEEVYLSSAWSCTVDQYAFSNSGNEMEIYIDLSDFESRSKMYIEGYAFSGAYISEIEITCGIWSNLLYIKDYAFSDCIGLTEVTLPSTAIMWGEGMFCGCKDLVKINSENSLDGVLYASNEYNCMLCYPSGREATEYTISDRVQIIGEYAFGKTENLKSITIQNRGHDNDHILHINVGAFFGSGVTSVYYEGCCFYRNIGISRGNDVLNSAVWYYQSQNNMDEYWAWNEYSSATLSLVSRNCGQVENIVAEADEVTSEVTKAASCTEDGVMTYTAKVYVNGIPYSSSKDITISALGHSYSEPAWEWNGYTSATATFECLRCACCEVKTATVTSKVTKDPTYASPGTTTYTATVEFNGETYTGSYEDNTKPAQLSFKDVSKNEWFHDSAAFVADKGIMTGTDAAKTQFEPFQPFARAQFAVVLHRTVKEPSAASTNNFPDVKKGEWYYNAVMWASSKGIISGYQNGYFGPADVVTREQFAVMLYRYHTILIGSANNKADLTGFSDYWSVSDWANEAIQWAVGNKIITGKDSGTRLAPQDGVVRCEAAAMIQRYYSNVVE